MTTDQIHTSIDKIENDLSDLIDSLSDFDTHEMENRTQSSINSFQTEFLKKSQFPILVKALVSYKNWMIFLNPSFEVQSKILKKKRNFKIVNGYNESSFWSIPNLKTV